MGRETEILRVRRNHVWADENGFRQLAISIVLDYWGRGRVLV